MEWVGFLALVVVGLIALVNIVIFVRFCVFPSKMKEPLQDDIPAQSLGNDKEWEEGGGLSQTEIVSGQDIRAPDMLSTAKQQESESLSGSTYYELLGVDRNATDEEIKKAWRKRDSAQYLPLELRRAYHAAYKTLSDPEERRQYDAKPLRWSSEVGSEKGRQAVHNGCKTNRIGESFQTKPPQLYGGQAAKGRSGYIRGQGTYPPLHREGIGHENPVYLTQSGLDSLSKELDHLVSKRRPEIAQQIAEAKAEGNVRKNAGYEEAKNAQAFVEGRIRELKGKIGNAQIINDSQTPDGQVALGRRVVIRESGNDYDEFYTIVGSTEAAPANGRISNESPLGKALIGRTAGAVVRFKAPEREFEYGIVRVE